MAKKVASQAHVKPLVMKTTLHERLPFAGLALVALFSDQLGAFWTIVLVYALLIWQGIGGGLTGNAWQIMVCKLIPSDLRSMFFSLQGAGVNFMSSIGAFITGMLLERQPGSFGYFLAFTIAFISMMVSYVLLNTIREDEAEEVLDIQSAPPLLTMATKILKTDHSFRWFVISRFLIPFGNMAAAYYIIYVKNNLLADERLIGTLASTQFISTVIAGIVLGWISDHLGRKSALQISLFFIVAAPIVAYFAPSAAWFYLIFVMVGVINGAFWSVFLSFTLEFGTDMERPTYVGLINTLIAPSTLLAQLLGGWIADRFGFSITFIVAAIFAAIVFAFTLIFVKEPHPRHKLA
ncbi:MAG: MFS transporter [Anaerolineae bacterium]|nr:MFS transporter [Anaerolineae bacterium]